MKLNMHPRKKMTDINKDEAISEVRKILQKSGIPKEVVDQWMADPKAAVENQKTEILIQLKDKIIDLTNIVNQLEVNVIDLQKELAALKAWKWRQEGK
jgi:hypothetical protein